MCSAMPPDGYQMAATRFEHEPFSIIVVTLQDWTLYGQASEDSVASACFS